MQWLRDLFISLIQAVLSLVDGFLCALQEWICWFLNWMLGFWVDIITTWLEFIPDSTVPDVSSIVAWVNVVNSWVPLGFAFVCLMAYGAHQLGFIVFKQVSKKIPTIG